MLTSSHPATTAVEPTCPRCGHRVRSSIQLRAELADLATRLAAAYALVLADNGSAAAETLYRRNLAQAEATLAGLEAELAGGHLNCTPAVLH